MKNKVIIAAVVLVVLSLLGFWYWKESQPGKFDDFAKCLKDKGAQFYGAFWCPHCQNQKNLFGSSAKYLPYIECSTQDSKGQLPVCNEAKIQAYPTWKFADGSTEQGEVTLLRLAEKSGCQLPQ